jgi:DHA2 family methylenomycin A resistance protein-like MFS transporter
VAADGTYSLALPLALVGIGMGLAGAAQQSSGLAAWPVSLAGSAAGTLSFMRYVGSVAGASLLAAVLGREPGAGEFEALLAILACAALANGALALWGPGSRSRAGEQLAQSPA